MAKQSISGRVGRLARADLPALLAHCDDPEQLADQLVADYTMTIAEAESALVQLGTSVRLLEQDHAEDVAIAAEWARRVEQTTDAAPALADTARRELAAIEQQVAGAEPAIAALRQLHDGIEDGVAVLRERLRELTEQRRQLVTTAGSASGGPRGGSRSVDLLDPAQDLERFDAIAAGEAP